MKSGFCARAVRVLAMACALWMPALGAQTVEFFSPQGEVEGVRQVTARFGTAMVPFGDPRELDPFDIDCVEKGKGRWADMKNWVYDFDRDLPAGVRCTFSLKPGLTSLDGEPVKGAARATRRGAPCAARGSTGNCESPHEADEAIAERTSTEKSAAQRFAFTTGGPAILRSLPWEGARIDENQIFVLGLDAPARAETILAHAHCVAAGVNEQIGVRILTGDERRLVLDNRKSFAFSYLRLLLLDFGAGRTRAFTFRLPATGSDDEKFVRLRDGTDSPLVTLACARTLPAGAEAKLVWGKGIASTSGVPTSEDQALAFRVRPAFRASFSCDRVNRDAQCIPILSMSLSFSAPISKRDAAKIRLIDATGKIYAAKLPAQSDTQGVDSMSFGPGLPEKQSFTLEIPADLQDDAGRRLSNASSFPLKVRTDENPPLVKFAAGFGILERIVPPGTVSLLPVTLRNVEPQVAGNVAALGMIVKHADGAPIPGHVARVAPGDEMKIIDWLRRLEAADRVQRQYHQQTHQWQVIAHGHARSVFDADDVTQKIAVPKPNGAKAFEVVGIPLGMPGFYVVELASPKLGAALLAESKPYYVRASTLVTNLSVHFKLGRESSLVWVTRLSDGKPVGNARVEVLDCAGSIHWRGKSDPSGIAKVAQALPERVSLPYCIGNEREYFVVARAGDDMAFAFSSWGEGISPWRFNVPTGKDEGPYVAHAVLDRSLFRAGETASMKIFVRKQTGDGFSLVPRDALSDTLIVRHQGSEREYTVPVRWNGANHGEATFAIPKDAQLGTYTIDIKDSLALRMRGSDERYAGRFRVEAFRIPLMRARLQAVGTPLVNPSEVTMDMQVSYLSGGGAGGLAVKLRTQVEPKAVEFSDFEGYAFAAGDVKEGRDEEGDSAMQSGGYSFSDPDMNDEDSDADADSRPGRQSTTDLNLSLDAAGGARAAVKSASTSDRPRDLVAELEYRDPNGETLTASTRVALWPARIVLGIKPDGWAATGDRLKFSVIALDLAGAPVAGVRVRTDAFKRETYSHRRRLIGGFYAYEHGSETRRLGDLCAGETDAHGVLICEVAAPSSGNLILRARAADREGNIAVTRADTWVVTGDDWWFAASDNDRIDLLPEKKRYEPGDVARLQLRTPFKEATVLVTVEREGVLESFVRTVNRSEPVIDVPIKGNYAPNVFISAFAVRGRIGGVAPTALIDLAKPSYKMGLAEIRVGWAAHELRVKVTPAQAEYKVRDKASVAIAVRRADGSAPPPGSEIAIAAVDEGLLELLPNDTWKLLDAMMTRRGEEVETSTAQMQVIGKRHFGRKAIPAGGGGGRQSARELFDTLLLWKSRVPLDAAGNATVDVPLNDSLTSFRIVAIASSGAALFGTGSASIRATQELMLLSGMPPLVREGDRFRATITVRNASGRSIPVTVTARVNGVAQALERKDADLAAGEAKEIGWDVMVPVNALRLDWRVEATERITAVRGEPVEPQRPLVPFDEAQGMLRQAQDERLETSPDVRREPARDALKVSQKVVPAVPERTFQAAIFQLAGQQSISVQRPGDAIPGRGGVNVRMQARLAGDLPGVREYLSWYPYSCFEQMTSIAVGLRDSARWDYIMRVLPAYLDGDGMVKYWPLLAYGDDTLTAYVLSIADEADWPIPDDSRGRMEKALIGFIEGRVVRYSALPTADLSIRKIAALQALSRRAEPINAKWLDSIAVEPNLWPTSAVIDWYLILKRTPKLAQRDERMKQAEQILRSRLNFQGTTMGFSTEKSDALWWLMISADSNANRLLIAMLDAPQWRDDMPRLARGALGRMQRGHWNTTVANAWGVLAIEKFSDEFESAPMTGTTTATLAAERFAHTWSEDDDTQVFEKKLPWPAQRQDLSLRQTGSGKPWVTLQSIAAIPLKTALSTGYKITREVTSLQQQVNGRWSRGDVARVHLEIEAQADMTWVVVDDPIPAGATVLGRGLGGDSTLLAKGEKKQGTVWPAFEERTFEAFRAYYRYVPKGRFIVEYTVRLNNPGSFHLPTTRVEAMYAPEMFGELPNADWTVVP